MNLEKIPASEIHPHVLEVKNASTTRVNHTITSEGVVEIVENTLKIAGNDAKNDSYFVDSENDARGAY